MTYSNIKANQNVDQRYQYLRCRHGQTNPQANGYRLNSFFIREQRVVLSELDYMRGPFLDIACGSGLMLSPLIDQGHKVYGLDFNTQACVDAQNNGIEILRGDAFNMPFSNNSIGQIVNCQFLNQQSPTQTERFICESARVLKPDGQMIILWRHARSLIHITSHALFSCIDKLVNQPSFPQYVHPLEKIKTIAQKEGLRVKKEAVTLPFLKPDVISPDIFRANIIGASLVIVLEKS